MFKLCVSMLVLFTLVSCKNANKKSEDSTKLKSEKAILMDLELGKTVYRANCAACHQRNGMGIPRVHPPIVNTKNSEGDKNYLIETVLNGARGEIKVEGEKYNNVMTNFKKLSDNEIAQVLNYIRNGFDNSAEVITAEEVKALR
ncbi:c-type cytochrome [Saccharicrinis aurantiacus]|uniref:c-type cytochrome n=1 Tax=Saccharicrinis aurantiacus TaxID=1849719 RepID=UPI00094F552B|nr:cytochrome c [Saccharicrinis aurantiacus]